MQVIVSILIPIYNYIRMDNETSIFWAAFGGGAAAGIFTLLAVLLTEWIRWFIDRPLVRVNVSFVRFNMDDSLFSKDKLYIGLEAKNPHTKTIILSTFGFFYKSKADGKLQTMPDGLHQFPYVLEAGKAISQFSDEENLFKVLKETDKKPTDLKYAYFTSSAGKTFCGKIPRVTMQTLEKHFKDYSK
jgi:hypothetical protein